MSLSLLKEKGQTRFVKSCFNLAANLAESIFGSPQDPKPELSVRKAKENHNVHTDFS